MKKLILLTLTTLTILTGLHAQSAFRSRTSGDWNNILTWEKWNGTAWDNPSSPTDFPGASDSVYIQLLHTVTLTQSHSCNHLNLNNGIGVRLDLNDFNLLVSGRISLFTGAANFPVTYTFLNLGASVDNGTNNSGNIRLVGNSRTVFRAGEWATNFTTLNLQIVLIDNTQIADVDVDLTVGRLTILSGDVNIDGNLFMDNGTSGGDIFIGAATVLSVAKSIMRNTLSAPADSIIIWGTLRLNSALAGNSLVAAAVNLMPGGVLDMHNTEPLVFTVTNYTINAASRLLYSGNVPDQPTGNEFPRNGIRNLVINTTGSVNLNTGKNISDTLVMLSGNINVPLGDSLRLGVGANAVLQHTSGSIIGRINRYIPALTANVVLFPVGSDEHYRPINIDFAGASIASGNISVEHVSDTGGTDVPAFSDGSFLINRRSNMYWDIDVNGGLLAANIGLNAGINGQSGVTDSAELRLIGNRDNDLSLGLLGGVSIPILSDILGLQGVDLDSNNVRLYLGGNLNVNPLPVKFDRVSAYYTGSDVIVNWATVTERNNDYFEVQRAADGKTFSTVYSMPGKGNSSEISTYVYSDMAPFSGDNYYRIAQYDHNRNVSYSKTVKVNTNELGSASVTLGPNPASDVLTVGFNNTAYTRIEVIDMLGRVHLMRAIGDDANSISLDISHLVRGTYLVQLSNNEEVVQHQRIIKQ